MGRVVNIFFFCVFDLESLSSRSCRLNIVGMEWRQKCDIGQRRRGNAAGCKTRPADIFLFFVISRISIPPHSLRHKHTHRHSCNYAHKSSTVCVCTLTEIELTILLQALHANCYIVNSMQTDTRRSNTVRMLALMDLQQLLYLMIKRKRKRCEAVICWYSIMSLDQSTYRTDSKQPRVKVSNSI